MALLDRPVEHFRDWDLIFRVQERSLAVWVGFSARHESPELVTRSFFGWVSEVHMSSLLATADYVTLVNHECP